MNRGTIPLLLLRLFALILALLAGPALLAAADPDTSEAKAALPQGLLDFDACVRLALQQSPYLTKSSVEIDIRRLDENDSRWTMFPPPMTFRSYYYVTRPNQPGINPKPYSLSFTMDPYNPLGSYFSLQVQKAATQFAILAHLKIISDGLERMGKYFLALGAAKRLTALQDDLVKVARENLTYAENRQSIGTGTSLEVRVAKQELDLATREKERLDLSRRRTMSSLKTFLGLKSGQQVDFDLRDPRRQVLGKFDSNAATLEQAKARSYELKSMELRKEMQKYNVLMAKAKVLPSILFTSQTPDPLSVTSASGIYIGLGLEVPVWDGLKRIRNVSRQKAILKEYGSDKDLREIDLTDKWNTLQEDLKVAGATLNMAQSQEELVRLKERQAEIRYQSGSEPLPTMLEARKATIDGQKAATSKALDYDNMILSLRTLSGDLGYTYVDEKSFQK